MIVCTSICANYLPKAMALADSFKRANPDVFFQLCLVERESHPEADSYPNFDRITLAKDLGFGDFDQFIFGYSIVEASTAVKGQLFKYLLDEYPEEDRFVYLDPDILVISDLSELYRELNDHDIVLTPHLTTPESKGDYWATIDAVMDNELCALQHGVYNLGFLAIKRSSESQAFVEWWASRLSMFCHDDIPKGIFTDQRWIDLAPCFFDVHILKHPGYNVAPWNLSTRLVSLRQGSYYANEYPIRFFHFTGFDSGANEAMINKYVPDRKNPVYALRDDYTGMLVKHGQIELGKLPWSYDFFLSGEKIKHKSRIAYRNSRLLQEKHEMPFSESNTRFRIVDSILTKAMAKTKRIYQKLLAT